MSIRSLLSRRTISMVASLVVVGEVFMGVDKRLQCLGFHTTFVEQMALSGPKSVLRLCRYVLEMGD